jgi:hypothetical protein
MSAAVSAQMQSRKVRLRRAHDQLVVIERERAAHFESVLAFSCATWRPKTSRRWLPSAAGAPQRSFCELVVSPFG